MKSLFIFFVLMLNAINIAADTLSPFTSDGCSLFPDGTFEQQNLWLDCCMLHDFDYWKGGTYQERSDADNALKKCVAEVGASKTAFIMLIGVRVGGSAFLPTPFRWGYGWSYPRFYGELTITELQQVKDIVDVIESP